MKRTIFVFLPFVSALISAQTEIGLDASASTVTTFGGDAVEIRGAVSGDLTFDIYLIREQDEWYVTRTDVGGNGTRDVDVQFALASVTPEAVIVSNILVDGRHYSGLFLPEIDPTEPARVSSSSRTDSLPVFVLPAETPESSFDAPQRVSPVTPESVPAPADGGTHTVVSDQTVDASAGSSTVGSTADAGQVDTTPVDADPAPSDAAESLPTTPLEELEQRVFALESAGLEAIERFDDLQEAVETGSDQITMLATLLREIKAERLVEGTATPVAGDGGGGILSLSDARTGVTRPIRAGFSGASEALGSWSISDGVVEQNDSEAMFAKLRLPLEQSGLERVLYRFGVSSPEEGWVGAGLHVFASDVHRSRGYGHGDSVLVWLTRDYEAYETNRTYLQLYRSTTDVEMERVAHAALPEHLAGGLDVEVLLDPITNYLTVGIDGDERLRYYLFFPLAQGYEIALRSLDRARFSDLRVTGEHARNRP